MNYIFFDIECANCQGGRAKICSFGYVVTNEHFKILDKQDWIINPKAPFMLSGRGNHPYIQFAYKKEEFKNAPTFPERYEDLKKLLLEEDALIFGYAADNDAGYLKSEFERYHLPCINFTYYDLQKLLQNLDPQSEKSGNMRSLLTAAELFGAKENQDIHKSDDDALLTMRVLEGLVRTYKKSAAKLVIEHPGCRGDLIDNKIYIRYLEEQNVLVRILGDKSDRITPKSENRLLYQRFIRFVRPSAFSYRLWLRGRKVSIPEKFAERHFSYTLKLIQLICDCGGRYVIGSDNCHIFINYPIYSDDGKRKDCAELEKIAKRRTFSRGPAIYTPSDFLNQCGCSPELFEKLPVPDVRYLLDERYALPARQSKREAVAQKKQQL